MPVRAERNATTIGDGDFIVTVTTSAPTNSTFTDEQQPSNAPLLISLRSWQCMTAPLNQLAYKN
jgi:hypothetical protein